MFPASSGTLEAFRRSFLMGIAEIPLFFQQQSFLVSRFALKQSTSLLRFLAARFLLMDKPYWREDQLRNWHVTGQTWNVSRDSVLEPYSLIHQRVFEDILNDHDVLSLTYEDAKLPSPYTVYTFPETQYILPQSNTASKSLRFAHKSSISLSAMASPFTSTGSNVVLRGFSNSKKSPSLDSDESVTSAF